jgi:glycosyltransferase involved in cell wall biosynthesis
MKLSILICHIKSRELFLLELRQCLAPQIDARGDEVEVLVDDSEHLSIGTKRNNLLLRAKGNYIAFCDDDDLLVNNYVDLVLKAIETNPDCVGMRGILQDEGKHQGLFEHSLKHKDWFQQDGDVRWCRPPNHLNPVKREHALKAMFTDKNCGEDFDYSMALKPFLKTEVFIEEPIYLYRHHSK